MKHDPHVNIDARGEDIWILSNGHLSPVYYSTSPLQTCAATCEHLPGVRIAPGSLGQGRSAIIGAALAKRLNNDETVVFSLHGDGESDERQVWEVKALTQLTETP
jgi:transketolase